VQRQAFAGLLWLLLSLPVVTVLVATAGLYSVTKDWVDGPPAVWSTFWSGVRRHVWQGLAFGGLLMVVGAIVTADVIFVLNADGTVLRGAVLAMAFLLSLAASGVMVFLFPVMTTYEGTWRKNLRNAVMLAGGFPGTALLGVAILAVSVLAGYAIPLLLPLVAGFAAFGITRLTNRVFARLPERPEGPA
jgi:uncharacterized membrane protein YesL